VEGQIETREIILTIQDVEDILKGHLKLDEDLQWGFWWDIDTYEEPFQLRIRGFPAEEEK
jgi:hypothetical protein